MPAGGRAASGRKATLNARSVLLATPVARLPRTVGWSQRGALPGALKPRASGVGGECCGAPTAPLTYSLACSPARPVMAATVESDASSGCGGGDHGALPAALPPDHWHTGQKSSAEIRHTVVTQRFLTVHIRLYRAVFGRFCPTDSWHIDALFCLGTRAVSALSECSLTRSGCTPVFTP